MYLEGTRRWDGILFVVFALPLVHFQGFGFVLAVLLSLISCRLFSVAKRLVISHLYAFNMQAWYFEMSV